MTQYADGGPININECNSTLTSNIPLEELHKVDDNYGLSEWFNKCLQAFGFKSTTALIDHDKWLVSGVTSYKFAKKGRVKRMNGSTKHKLAKFFQTTPDYISERLAIDLRPESVPSEKPIDEAQDENADAENSTFDSDAKNEVIENNSEAIAESITSNSNDETNTASNKKGFDITVIQDPHGKKIQTTQRVEIGNDTSDMTVTSMEINLAIKLKSQKDLM